MGKKLAIVCIIGLTFGCTSSETEQRQRIPDGVYRPSGFHAFISHGDENIPVSLVKADSLYHLFYTTGSDEWGHLKSNNLLTWTPDTSIPLREDTYGEVIWDENNTTELNAPWVLIQNNDGSLNLSYSTDGIEWSEYSSNPVLDVEGNLSIQWNVDLELWILTIANGNSISFYTSEDLMEWKSASNFTTDYEAKKATLLSDEGQWFVLIQSENLFYQTGMFDGNSFEPTGIITRFDQLNFKLGAISSLTTESLFISRNLTNNDQLPTFSTPLSLSLEEGQLKLYPSNTFDDEIVGKRRTKLAKLFTDGPSWYSFRIDQEFDEVEIVVSDNSSEIKFSWDKNENKVLISGSALASKESIEKILGTNIETTNLKVDILVDHASVDLFLNNGAYATTILSIPDTFFSGVQVFLDGEKYDARGVLYDIGL